MRFACIHYVNCKLNMCLWLLCTLCTFSFSFFPLLAVRIENQLNTPLWTREKNWKNATKATKERRCEGREKERKRQNNKKKQHIKYRCMFVEMSWCAFLTLSPYFSLHFRIKQSHTHTHTICCNSFEHNIQHILLYLLKKYKTTVKPSTTSQAITISHRVFRLFYSIPRVCFCFFSFFFRPSFIALFLGLTALVCEYV